MAIVQLNRKISLPFAFAVFVAIGCSEGRSYINYFDNRVDFECSYSSEAISSIYSYHENHYEDRRFAYECRTVPYRYGYRRCHYSAYWENDYDELIAYQCPPNHYIAGMESIHDNQDEDRRWKYKCCGYSKTILHGCEITRWTNDLDGRQDFRVPTGKVITGVISFHLDRDEDRRFRYIICDVGSSLKD